LETKFKIIVDFEDGKRAINKNVEDDLRCYREVINEIKKART
jgi:hypothetical protein